MPLFGLSDITFKEQNASTGPLADLAGSQFTSNMFKYPADLGSSEKGHYMVIFARKQKASTSYNYNTADFVDEGITGSSRTGAFGKLLNTTTLTTDSIALYMPDTLLYSLSQNYSDISLTDTILGQAAAAGQTAVDAKAGLVQSSWIGLTSAVKSAIQRATARAGAVGEAAFFAATGSVKNPMLELIYRSPQFRQFQFDFFFYPRDENEATSVQKIVERLRFHQAPEVSTTTSNTPEYGFLIPPSEFDIRFYYNGQQNPNIPKIATCVLESIQLNYAPNGFSAYEVNGQLSPTMGGTGMPVAIQMTLQFKEVTFLTKADYKHEANLSWVSQG